MTGADFTPSSTTVAEWGLRECPFDWPEVVGVFVGGCVERGVGSAFRRQAHAHNHRGDPIASAPVRRRSSS
jgi:hypothetical protein